MAAHDGSGLLWLTFAVPLVVAAAGYLAAVVLLHRRGGRWPAGRVVLWCAGLTAAATAVVVPGATGHGDFTAHMTGHLLLGMAAPLLLVLAAPVTLALRTLPVGHARRLSRALRSRPLRILVHPVTAATVDAGGLWILYTTGVYQRMGLDPGLSVLVHAHVLGAGYLFTAAVVGVDPAPHRPGRRSRALVLCAFLAAHDILAKHLYGDPPAGVPVAQAHHGAQLMYYGGDLLDLLLITVFCWQWYVAAGPERIVRVRPRRAWRLPADRSPSTIPSDKALARPTDVDLPRHLGCSMTVARRLSSGRVTPESRGAG